MLAYWLGTAGIIKNKSHYFIKEKNIIKKL